MAIRFRTMTLLAALSAAFLLSGCSFWDWLAGQPISTDSVVVDASDRAAEPGAGADREDDAIEGSGDIVPGDRPGDAPSGDDGDPAGESETGGEAGPEPGAGGEGSEGDLPDEVPTGPFDTIRIAPVDESNQDPGFRQFHQRLRQIVQARDLSGLLDLVDPDIQNDFGGNDGIEAFREKWGLGDAGQAADSGLWWVLSDILDLGGVFVDESRSTFVAPYVYALYDLELDPYFHSVVTGAGVNVRSAPTLDAMVVAKVTHLVVRVLPAGDEQQPTIEIGGRTFRWRRIQLPSETIGYVADKYLRSPLDYRLVAERRGEDWRLTMLLAGD